MTIEMIAAICAGVVAVISAIAAAIVSVQSNKILKIDMVKKDLRLEDIHVLVNSRLSEALQEISSLRSQITLLLAQKGDE